MPDASGEMGEKVPDPEAEIPEEVDHHHPRSFTGYALICTRLPKTSRVSSDNFRDLFTPSPARFLHKGMSTSYNPQSEYPATLEQIVHTFLAIPHERLMYHNWGTAPMEFRDEWHANEETYINGVLLTIDRDYQMGYLIETVDRSTSEVSYIAICTFNGYRPDGTIDHDSMFYEGRVGTFFEREIHSEEACAWAVDKIHGMMDAHHDMERAQARNVWADLEYRLAHCDECGCEHSDPREGCSCPCH